MYVFVDDHIKKRNAYLPNINCRKRVMTHLTSNNSMIIEEILEQDNNNEMKKIKIWYIIK